VPESEKSDGAELGSVAAADTDFVTGVSGWGDNVAMADRFPTGSPS
jgi:hypothetical protein